MKPGALTDEQLEQFRRDGYIVLPSVFTDAEVRQMQSEADRILELVVNSSLANGRQSRRLDLAQSGDSQIVRKIQPINDLSLFYTQISQDARLLEPMRQILGCEPILMEEKLNYKEPMPTPIEGLKGAQKDDSFPVHNDWAYYKAQNYPQDILSSAISIDACTPGNGPLRVWPGSHVTHLEHQQAPTGGLEVKPGLIDRDASVPVLVPPGSVMIFHAILVHTSSGNTSGRPRRLMIYSHYPERFDMGYPDKRNGPSRLREAPWEHEYYRKRAAGEFADTFRAPVFEPTDGRG